MDLSSVTSLLHRAGEPVRFDYDGIAYALAVPSVLGAVQWRRAIAARGGRKIGMLGLVLALRQAVARTLMADAEAADRDAVLAQVDAQVERVRGMLDAARAVATDPDAFVAAQQAVAAGEDEAMRGLHRSALLLDADYAAVVGDEEVFWDIAGIEAARMFLVDWARDDTHPAWASMPPVQDLARERGQLSETSLASIPPHHFAALGVQLDTMTRPAEAERKN